MRTLDGRSYEPSHDILPKTDITDEVPFFKYNCQSLNLMNEKSYIGNGRFFYFNNDGKLEIFYMQKKYYL